MYFIRGQLPLLSKQVIQSCNVNYIAKIFIPYLLIAKSTHLLTIKSQFTIITTSTVQICIIVGEFSICAAARLPRNKPHPTATLVLSRHALSAKLATCKTTLR